MPQFLLIFLGGGLGAVCRWGLSTRIERLVLRSPHEGFPWGILACNLLGCLAIGVVFGLVTSRTPAWLFPLLVTGFLGGFTTFSTFGKDAQTLFSLGEQGQGFAYVLASTIGGILLVLAGLKLAALAGPAAPSH